MQPSSIALRGLAFAATLLALGLLAPPQEAAERRSSSGDRGKTTATRGSSSSGASAGRTSSTPGRGSRAAARARSGRAATRDSAGSASARGAVRGSGGGTQVALGRATYGHGSYGSGYGLPYYHYRPYYSYPSWWIGSYGWAYYGAPSAYFASVGWPYAWSTYCWPAYYDAWAYSGSGRPPRSSDDEAWSSDRVGSVELDIAPKKARVILNGDDIGMAKDYNGRWDELRLPEGMHRIDFEYPGYRTFRVYLDIRSGREYRVEERLERGDGLDPRSMDEPKPKVPPRPRREAAPDRDDAAAVDTPRMPRAKRSELDFEGFDPPDLDAPALRRGLLRLDVEPADAAIYLDGKFLARAGELSRLHGALPVAAGEHELEIVHPGFRTEARTVDVEAGREPTEIRIRLERRE